MLSLVIVLVILQLWLLMVTMNVYLGGDDSVIVPAAAASPACLLLNAGLLRYLHTSSARESDRSYRKTPPRILRSGDGDVHRTENRKLI